MQQTFSARDLAAAILVDLRTIGGAQKYLDITDGAQTLIDRFARMASAPERTPQCGKTLRAALTPRVSGDECVYAFYYAVIAQEGREVRPKTAGEQRREVETLADIIIGEGRSVDLG